MANLAQKANKVDQRAFNTWFNRWIKQADLEHKILVSAAKGMKYFTVCELNRTGDKYLELRFNDSRFLLRLRECYPDINFKIERVERYALIGPNYTVTEVIASWGDED